MLSSIKNPNTVYIRFALEMNGLFVEKQLYRFMFLFLGKLRMDIFHLYYIRDLFSSIFEYTDPTENSCYQDIVQIGCSMLEPLPPYELFLSTLTTIKYTNLQKIHKEICINTFTYMIINIYRSFIIKLKDYVDSHVLKDSDDLKLQVALCYEHIYKIIYYKDIGKSLKELLKEFRPLFRGLAHIIRTTKW